LTELSQEMVDSLRTLLTVGVQVLGAWILAFQRVTGCWLVRG